MTGKRKKRAGVKLISFVAGAVLMTGLVSSWLTPCSGMDTLTRSELGELSGQDGLSIAWCDDVTATQTFTSIGQGDTDGWGNNQDNNAGWIVLIGTGSNTGYVSVTTKEAVLTVDVATAGATTCTPGGASYAGIKVPAGVTFFTFSLTQANIELVNPETVYICGTYNSQITPAASRVGWMKPVGLAIDKADMKSTCYIWAHDW